MLKHFRTYQNIISRAVILLFLLTGSLGAWASTSVAMHQNSDKTDCTEHVMVMDSTDAEHDQLSDSGQHDCCKTQKTCNKHCCKFCLVSGINNIVLFDAFVFPVIFQSAQYISTINILPAGVKSATPYRPPQTLQI